MVEEAPGEADPVPDLVTKADAVMIFPEATVSDGPIVIAVTLSVESTIVWIDVDVVTYCDVTVNVVPLGRGIVVMPVP